MVHPDYKKYKMKREEFGNLPHFNDFTDPRFSMSTGGNGQCQQLGVRMYLQWIHCIGEWGEEHSMCKKVRWYVERMMDEFWLEKWDEKKAVGMYDHTLFYGIYPYPGFVPLYQPVKKNHKGAYEFWADRDFEPLYDPEAAHWKDKAPILHDVMVKGKKPIFDE